MDTSDSRVRVLSASFYARDSATVARDLLGCIVVSTAGGTVTSGRVVETEAYLGAEDPGSHAATKGITKRNAVMYGPPGRAYVYFTYGNHHMFNVVTEPEGTAGAVLLRALEPLDGFEEMARRRAPRGALSTPPDWRDLASGPGRLACALGIDLACNGSALDGSATLCLLDRQGDCGAIAASGRVGLSAGHDLELRFYLEGDPYVSRGRPGARSSRPRKRKA
jgi:DNA-3-methyladenine glycosylase